MPSMNAPSFVTRQFFSKPYCDPANFHHSGVNLPRTSPKSPGDVHVPISTPFTQTVISDGQSLFVPGASDDSSIESSNCSNSIAPFRLFGNLYSTKPRSNQISPAIARCGLKNVSGTSRNPIISSREQRPHGGDTSKSVYKPMGMATSMILRATSFFMPGSRIRISSNGTEQTFFEPLRPAADSAAINPAFSRMERLVETVDCGRLSFSANSFTFNFWPLKNLSIAKRVSELKALSNSSDSSTSITNKRSSIFPPFACSEICI